MAPEQIEGEEADARTDIFAFGAVVYEMVTGKRAFEGRSQASLVGAIMHAEPAPLSSVKPLAPRSVDRLVRKCLAKDPDDRWQTARDLRDDLKWAMEAVAQEGAVVPVARPRPGRSSSARLAWIVAAIALAWRRRPCGSKRRDTTAARPVTRFEIRRAADRQPHIAGVIARRPPARVRRDDGGAVEGVGASAR